MGLKTVMGLWVTEKAGRKYMSGKAKEQLVIPEGARVLIFRNDRKEEGSKQPDYNILISEDD